MCKPGISVIVPIYNAAEYLEKCIVSIMNQTFRDVEIICVNDGSTDEGLEILERLASVDERITIISRDQPSGSGALPRNVGLEQATGKYVIFLDSDDWFDVTMLEKMYRRAEEMQADLVMCDGYQVLSSGEVVETNQILCNEKIPVVQPFSLNTISDRIFQITILAAWNKLILRETLVVNDIRFQLNTPSADDMYFVCNLLVKAKHICTVKEPFIYYRKGRKESQMNAIEKHISSKFFAFNEICKMLKREGVYKEVKNSIQESIVHGIRVWLQSIENYEVFAEAYELYTKEYFYKLELDNMDVNLLSGLDKGFYKNIAEISTRVVVNCESEKLLQEGKTIVIYGAGYAGKVFNKKVEENQLYKVKLWCDKIAREIGTKKIEPVDKIFLTEYDAIVIAITSKVLIEEVKQYLANKGISKEKIYIFSDCK